MLSFNVTPEQYEDKEYMAPIYEELNKHIEANNKGRVFIYDMEAIEIKRKAARRSRYKMDVDAAKAGTEVYANYIIEMEHLNYKYYDALYEPGEGISVIWKPKIKVSTTYPEWDEYGMEDPIGYTLFVH